MIQLIIALFLASQHPTHKNCSELRDQLTRILNWEYGLEPGRPHIVPVTYDQELTQIKNFATKVCKDGVKR